MSRWIDSDGILEFIEDTRTYKNPKTEQFLNSIGITTTKDRPVDHKSFYRFSTIAKHFDVTIANVRAVAPELGPAELYVVNSHGLRSDEFTIDHVGKHLLFAGCSITAGEGLPLEFVWAKKVYEEISKTEETSGYFNIAAPGSSITEIMAQIFKYIDLYGNPDALFVNLPDPDREYYYLSSFDVRHSDLSEGLKDPMSMVNIDRINDLAISAYKSLYLYCKATGIDLYSCTWSNPEWRKSFEHYRGEPRYLFKGLDIQPLDSPDAVRHVLEFEKANSQSKYKKYFHDAFDESHPGIAIQDFYYKLMYTKYITK